MTLSEALKQYRQQNKLMQKEMADLLSITREYYASIEEGHKFPSPELLQRIQEKLHIHSEFYPPATNAALDR